MKIPRLSYRDLSNPLYSDFRALGAEHITTLS